MKAACVAVVAALLVGCGQGGSSRPAACEAAGEREAQNEVATAFENGTGPDVDLGGGLSWTGIAFSQDGRSALITGTDGAEGTFALWDLSPARQIRTFPVRQHSVTLPALAPGGGSALIGDPDGGLELWHLTTGKKTRTFAGLSSEVLAAAFSPDGRTVVAGTRKGTLAVWDAATARLLRSFTLDQPIWPLAFSPDARYALAGNGQGGGTMGESGGLDGLALWNMDSGKKVWSYSAHGAGVLCVTFSSTGRYALSGRFDGTVNLWEVATGGLVRTLQGNKVPVNCAAFTPDGRRALVGDSKGVARLWELDTGRELRPLARPYGAVGHLALSRDGQRALTLSSYLVLWDLNTGEEIRTFTGPWQLWRGSGEFTVCALAFLPDGKRVLTADKAAVRLWDIAEARLLQTIETPRGSAEALAVSTDGGLALWSGMDPRLVLWDIPNARTLWTVDSGQGWVHAVVFSPDGSLAASGGTGDKHGDLRFWDVKTGQCIRTLAAHAAGRYTLAFSPDGKLLLSEGTDNTAKLWEVATGRLVRTLADADGASLAFSPDGKILYSRGPSVRSWDAASGKLLRAGPVPAPSSEQGPLHYAFSADGKVGVRALRWGMLLEWDTVSGRILRTFERKGMPEEVWALAVSPDAKTILSAGAGGTLALWDAASGNVFRTIRNAPTGQRPGVK